MSDDNTPITTNNDITNVVDNNSNNNINEILDVVILTTTRYESIDDIRLQICIQMLEAAIETQTIVIIVDCSPNEQVVNILQNFNTKYVKYYKQTYNGKKGAALREAASIASTLLPNVNDNTILCFQEPEKIDMARKWKHTVLGLDNDVDVMVMYRDINLFQHTYPIEQYYSEMYGNFFLDTVAEDAIQHELIVDDPNIIKLMEQSNTRIPKYDWHFGPFAFKVKYTYLWIKYTDGDSYDAQIVPIVHAMRKGLHVKSVYVNYEAPKEMKNDEENNSVAIERRLIQLYNLDPRIKQAWYEDFYC